MNTQEILTLRFIKSHPVAAARVLEQLPVNPTVDFLQDCPPSVAAQIVEFLAPALATLSLEKMTPDHAAAIISELPLDIAAIQLRPVNQFARSEILSKLPREVTHRLDIALKFTENSAGAIMDQQVFVLQDDLSVKEALSLVEKNTMHLYYHTPIISRDHLFVGVTSLRELMQSKPDAPIASIIDSSIGRLSPTSTREAILTHPDWRVYTDLPVVDDKGIFLGVIAYQNFRKLETEGSQGGDVRPAYDAGKALGELYWIGISAFFKGAAAFVTTDQPAPGKSTEKEKPANLKGDD